jgi:hypothetical protein
MTSLIALALSLLAAWLAIRATAYTALVDQRLARLEFLARREGWDA